MQRQLRKHKPGQAKDGTSCTPRFLMQVDAVASSTNRLLPQQLPQTLAAALSVGLQQRMFFGNCDRFDLRSRRGAHGKSFSPRSRQRQRSRHWSWRPGHPG